MEICWSILTLNLEDFGKVLKKKNLYLSTEGQIEMIQNVLEISIEDL